MKHLSFGIKFKSSFAFQMRTLLLNFPNEQIVKITKGLVGEKTIKLCFAALNVIYGLLLARLDSYLLEFEPRAKHLLILENSRRSCCWRRTCSSSTCLINVILHSGS